MSNRPTPETTRRETVPSRTIRLSDGADWSFLCPAVRLTPRVVTETDATGRRVERVTLDIGFGYPTDVEVLIDALRLACERDSVPEQYESFFSLAAKLLLQAHNVDLQTVCSLLAVRDAEVPRLVEEVIAIVVARENTFDAESTESKRHEP